MTSAFPKLKIVENHSRSAVLEQDYKRIRHLSEAICEPLSPEDCAMQSMPDVSPPKWHLAHTTWFFENFVLRNAFPEYRAAHRSFGYLFNSYYKSVGTHLPRHQRGKLSRPSMEEILEYRRRVDDDVERFLREMPPEVLDKLAPTLELGLHHEQQHQELLLMDIKHILYSNPARPAYRTSKPTMRENQITPLHWIEIPEGLYEIGADTETAGFAFDNETPRHRVFLENFRIASRPVTNAEYCEFLRDGAYRNPLLWLSDGWDTVQRESWTAPLYWEKRQESWFSMTFSGMQPINPAEPVSHLSYYEADAYARWKGARLPSEAEWEITARDYSLRGNFLESHAWQPRPIDLLADAANLQLYGDVWEWTRSPYAAYPGFKALKGPLGEYNAKFMCNQFVLRGGSCFTPRSHIRSTYRNFFPPASRWQCGGLRLAEDGK